MVITTKDFKEFALDDLKKTQAALKVNDNIPADYLEYRKVMVKLSHIIDDLFDRYYSATVARENEYIKLSKMEDPRARLLAQNDYHKLLGEENALFQIICDLQNIDIVKRMEEQ